MAKQGPFNKTTLRGLFGNMDYPVHRDELIAKARDKGSSEPFIQALQQIPKRNYSNVDEVYRYLTDPGKTRPHA